MAEGVTADLVTGGMQGLQMRNPELVAVHVDPVREAATDIVGGLHAVVGEDRAGLGPGAGGEVVEAQGEDAARRRDGHPLDVEIARGPPAHLVDLLHGANASGRRLTFRPPCLPAKPESVAESPGSSQRARRCHNGHNGTGAWRGPRCVRRGSVVFVVMNPASGLLAAKGPPV